MPWWYCYVFLFVVTHSRWSTWRCRSFLINVECITKQYLWSLKRLGSFFFVMCSLTLDTSANNLKNWSRRRGVKLSRRLVLTSLTCRLLEGLSVVEMTIDRVVAYRKIYTTRNFKNFTFNIKLCIFKRITRANILLHYLRKCIPAILIKNFFVGPCVSKKSHLRTCFFFPTYVSWSKEPVYKVSQTVRYKHPV